MEFTNSELVEAQQALGKLEKMPIRISWALAKLAYKLEGPVRTVLNMRDTLVRQYQIEMTPQDDGGLLITSKVNGNAQKFGAEFNQLLTMTIELDVVKVKLPRTLKVEPSILIVLEKFVEI